MFGVLKPALGHVSSESKQLYHSTYCNLCASLSASGAGILNRFFLIHDVVTIDWLLAEEDESDHHVFACANCVKGGVIGKTSQVSSHQQFLAAISTYICGIKINDDAIDSPKLKNKSAALLYRPMMKKAEALLNKLNTLEGFSACLSLNSTNEARLVMAIDKACEPTEKFYELMTLEIAKTHSTLPQSTIELLGKYLGRCVYLLDAIEDMDEDREEKQYNVLNLLSSHQQEKKSKQNVMRLCLDFLKPMRLEITDKLTALSDSLKFNSLREKWESLFIGIEDQLSRLIKPLNDNNLINILASFSTLTRCVRCSQLSIDNDDFDCMGRIKKICGDLTSGGCPCKDCLPK